MTEKIDELLESVKAYKGDLETFRMLFTRRKGPLGQLFTSLNKLPAQERQVVGKRLNELREVMASKEQTLADAQEAAQLALEYQQDPTLPPPSMTLGTLHPLRLVERKIVGILNDIGFQTVEGREIESDFYNFSALNFPKDHPARDMQDTFFLDRKRSWLLRTHTSPTQVHMMLEGAPPFRIVAPGRVFRNETISARSHCIFHQVEGFYVDKKVAVADLKGTLQHLIRHFFGKGTKMRLRPSYFPFTEPSVEVDISCHLCHQKGCRLCKKTGWVEILGAGMIDPNVFEACRIDAKTYTGFAFGLGIERMAMLYYQIEDVRRFTQNDVRFLKQFA